MYAIGNEVFYIGSAQRGLHRRLQHYENSKNLLTAGRTREAVLKELSQGTSVDIYVIVLEAPLTLHGGLPIDPVAGVEEGLIRDIKPKRKRREMTLLNCSKNNGQYSHTPRGTSAFKKQRSTR